MIKMLGLGDNVCDIYLHTGIMYPGGQALNFAVYTSQLGVRADYMGVFGQDAVARHIQSVMDQKGIGCTHCRSYSGENGFARVTLVGGDRVFQGSNRGGVLQEHPIFLNQEDLDYIAGFDLVHTTNNGFIDDLLPQLDQLPPKISYDFSYRWNEEERVDRVCPYVDFGFLSCSALSDKQTEELCIHLCEKGCGMVTATRGEKGATVFDGKRFYRQLPTPVDLVDTMGAGDAFAAAMLVELVRMLKATPQYQKREITSEMMIQALQHAADFSACICLVHGAFDCGVQVPEEIRQKIYSEA